MGIVRVLRSLKSMPKSQYRQEAEFHYNKSDLYQNRNGRLSDRQMLRLRCMQVLSPLHIVMGVIIVTSFAIVFHVVIDAIASFQANAWPFGIRLLIGIVGMIFVVVLLSVNLIRRLKQLNSDIQNGQVEIKKGAIAFRRYRRNRIPFAYWMQIENKEYLIKFWLRWAYYQHAK